MIPFYCDSVVTFQSSGALLFSGNLTARPHAEFRCDIKFALKPKQLNYTLRVETTTADVYVALYLRQWKIGTPMPSNSTFLAGFKAATSFTDDKWSTSEYEQMMTIVLPADAPHSNATVFRTMDLRVLFTPHYEVCDNSETTFQCTASDYCVQKALQCDGNKNCGDSSDEDTCWNPETTPVPAEVSTAELVTGINQTTETVVIVVWWWRNWYYPTTAVLGGLLLLILVLSCIFVCAQSCSRICGKRRVQQSCERKEAAAFNPHMETVHVDLASCSNSLPPTYEELAVVSTITVIPPTEQHGCNNTAYH